MVRNTVEHLLDYLPNYKSIAELFPAKYIGSKKRSVYKFFFDKFPDLSRHVDKIIEEAKQMQLADMELHPDRDYR